MAKRNAIAESAGQVIKWLRLDVQGERVKEKREFTGSEMTRFPGSSATLISDPRGKLVDRKVKLINN